MLLLQNLIYCRMSDPAQSQSAFTMPSVTVNYFIYFPNILIFIGFTLLCQPYGVSSEQAIGVW